MGCSHLQWSLQSLCSCCQVGLKEQYQGALQHDNHLRPCYSGLRMRFYLLGTLNGCIIAVRCISGTEAPLHIQVTYKSFVIILSWKKCTCSYVVTIILGRVVPYDYDVIMFGCDGKMYILCIYIYSISQEICTRFCCALLCCGYAIVHN